MGPRSLCCFVGQFVCWHTVDIKTHTVHTIHGHTVHYIVGTQQTLKLTLFTLFTGTLFIASFVGTQ